MTKIKDVTTFLETIAPLRFQESYDNSGLLTGDNEKQVTGVLLSLDCTEEVVQEAIDTNCNLIIAHHPIIFNGLKKITGKNYVERTIILAIQNQVAIYAIHTNLDNVLTGVNYQLAKAIGLEKLSILQPKGNTLSKLITFVPQASTENVLEQLYNAGAGTIGNYYDCSFTTDGMGRFTPNSETNPSIGTHHVREKVSETRIEVLVPKEKEHLVLKKLFSAHPYEEVAYYLQPIENKNQEIGAGAIGELPNAMSSMKFLEYLKDALNLALIKYTRGITKNIKKVAICGGSGSFLLEVAKASKADAYVSADFKYHEYFDAENKLLICDIGHYESEVRTKDLLYDILSKKFSSFALNLSKVDTNPISYFK